MQATILRYVSSISHLIKLTSKRRKPFVMGLIILLLFIHFSVYSTSNQDEIQNNEKLISLLEKSKTMEDQHDTDILIENLRSSKPMENDNGYDAQDSVPNTSSTGPSDDKIIYDDVSVINKVTKGILGKIDSLVHPPSPEDEASAQIREEEFRKQRALIIKSIFSMIASAKPTVEYEKKVNDDSSLLDAGLLSEDRLNKYFQFDDEFIKGMQVSHSFIMDQIEGLPFPKGLYQGNGIAMVGGDKYSFMCLTSIKMMRRYGGKLPVEVIMPERDPKDNEFCEKLLTGLNAKCIYLTDLLGEDYRKKISINKYQYKGLALLASSFENLLLLDGDNIPITEVSDELFNDYPFQKYGMVFWPDFWKRTTSPKFYEIANVTVSNKRSRDCEVDLPESQQYELREKDAKSIIPFHDREGTCPDRSTESGQLLFSKTRHPDVLLLSLYYNAYGPHSYYDILSQDVAGEGDKDTFPVAATVLGKEFYQLKASVHANGYFDNGEYRGTSMIQFNPTLDYMNYLEFIDKIGKSEDKFLPDQLNDYVHSNGRSQAMFLHANFPKLLPIELLDGYVVKENEKEVEVEVEVEVEEEVEKEVEVEQEEGSEKEPEKKMIKVMEKHTEKQMQKKVIAEETRIVMYTDGKLPPGFEYDTWLMMFDYICNQRINISYTDSHEELKDEDKRLEYCAKKFIPHLKFLKSKLGELK